MPAPLLPINLTSRAESLRGTWPAGLAQPVFAQPGLRCDRIDAAGLQSEASASAAHDEVYVVVAGQGGVRCADGSVMEVTAGDVLHVARGTVRRFVDLSGKFLALRVSLFTENGTPFHD